MTMTSTKTELERFAQLAAATQVVRPDLGVAAAAALATRWHSNPRSRTYAIACSRLAEMVEMPAAMLAAWRIVGELLSEVAS